MAVVDVRPVSSTSSHIDTASWANLVHAPAPESRRSRTLAQIGGLVSIGALAGYIAWRILFTLPASGGSLTLAWVLIAFEALPLTGLILKTRAMWNLDAAVPTPVVGAPDGLKVAVLIPTVNEPPEVIAPTIAAACALEPAHETWVLDDGGRPWVAELCQTLGARYVARPDRRDAKAGNINNALDLIALDASNVNHALDLIADGAQHGESEVDLVAVLDCDHVPLPSFLTATLGWFADEQIALVQGAQAFYNNDAFDDGITGEQGLYFNVVMRARQAAGVGPLWCGSTAVLRVSALREIGGIAIETITEDMHTTLKLIKNGWRTVYHHQALALGLAPGTPEQYLVQRRRWALGAMQVLTMEKPRAVKRGLSWRSFLDYLAGTLWWLQGAATMVAFLVPALILASGADTSTAPPLVFALAFTAMLVLRMWGSKRLQRGNVHWATSCALRVLRIPVSLACVRWLVTRRPLRFEVTPKSGSHVRVRGMVPVSLRILLVAMTVCLGYITLGVVGLVPWHTTPESTVAAGSWLLLATGVLVVGTARITSLDFASSRRAGHRVNVPVRVVVDGVEGHIVDLSVSGAAIRLPAEHDPFGGTVAVELPGAVPIEMIPTTVRAELPGGEQVLAFRVRRGDWRAMHALSLWLFHTPPGAVPGLPDDVPAVACV